MPSISDTHGVDFIELITLNIKTEKKIISTANVNSRNVMTLEDNLIFIFSVIEKMFELQ